MAKGHRQGGKITSKHTSTIEPVAVLVDYLKGKEEVSKIVLGIIATPKTSRKSATKAIKILQEPAGLLLRVTQKNTIQELRVYSDNKEAVCDLIEDFATRNGWETRR
jgi:hypothetical protein